MTPKLRRLRWNALDTPARERALLRPAVRAGEEVARAVATIIANVRQRGDAAVLELTRKLDRAALDGLRVSEAEAERARAALTPAQLDALATAIGNIQRFHAAQRQQPVRVQTAPGVVCERVARAIRAVGLYVPAGSAPLPSTAIMLAVPARLAGCPTRILCTPPRPDGLADPAVVAAARLCGITEIFKAGGAQAIAAMAYGTESVPKVDKIFGPGNAWVTAAKAAVAADPAGAAQDMPAGPSEVMVIADSSAEPAFVALDLLSQAEHGPDSQVILVHTPDLQPGLVDAAIAAVLEKLPRREIIRRALEHALAIEVPDLDTAVDAANAYAPEHLIIQTDEPRRLVEAIDTAGSVFLGPWTPEAVGDYCSGTNHVLPTYGHARACSGLSVADFQRGMTIQELTRDGLEGLASTVTTLAALEGLDAHAEAVRVRCARGTRP